MGAPPPVVSRKPHAGVGRDPPGCKVRGSGRPLHVQEELPTGLGPAPVRACLHPYPPGLDPSPGMEAIGATPRREALPPSPQLPGAPAPRGRTHLRREAAWGTWSSGTRHRARTLARAAPRPGSPRRSALCRPAEARAE